VGWNQFWDTLADLSSSYLETFLAFCATPQMGPLPQRYKELIFITIKLTTKHLWSSEAWRETKTRSKLLQQK
jgi:hypothetical protein